MEMCTCLCPGQKDLHAAVLAGKLLAESSLLEKGHARSRKSQQHVFTARKADHIPGHVRRSTVTD